MPLVVSHYSVLPLEFTTAKKCHQFINYLLKNAIRDLKKAIAPLDVRSKMPLDAVTIRSNLLTMLYDENTSRSACQLHLSHNDKCGPNYSGVSKQILLGGNKNAIGDQMGPTLNHSEIEGELTCGWMCIGHIKW